MHGVFTTSIQFKTSLTYNTFVFSSLVLRGTKKDVGVRLSPVRRDTLSCLSPLSRVGILRKSGPNFRTEITNHRISESKEWVLCPYYQGYHPRSGPNSILVTKPCHGSVHSLLVIYSTSEPLDSRLSNRIEMGHGNFFVDRPISPFDKFLSKDCDPTLYKCSRFLSRSMVSPLNCLIR